MNASGTNSPNQAVAPPKGSHWDWWLASVLVALFFVPTLRLPGEIPLRLEDVLIFGTGMIALFRTLYVFRVPKINGPWLYLTLVPISILLCTLVAAGKGLFPIGPKEYLDLLRPIKFLIVFLVVARTPLETSQRTFIRVMSVAMIVLSLIAFCEFAFISVDSNGIITRFFLLYSELEEEHARTMLALRPYATLSSPTHLGYISTLGIFIGLNLLPRTKQKWIVGASLLALVISQTRTFLLTLPVLFIMNGWLGSPSVKERIKRLRAAVLLSVVGITLIVAILFITSSMGYDTLETTFSSIGSGDVQENESVGNRIQNLQLALYTWEHAPWFGVVTRSLLGPAVDSELLYTFHRYGLVGLAVLLALYPEGYLCARKARRVNPEMARFALMMLVITFLYGITQGAIINTRIGVIPFVVLGILSSSDKNSANESPHMEPRTATFISI